MALEDAAVLGELFGRSTNPRDPAEKRRLLGIYEKCRKPRTEMVVDLQPKARKLAKVGMAPPVGLRVRCPQVGKLVRKPVAALKF